jgi:hypothetical protein
LLITTVNWLTYLSLFEVLPALKRRFYPRLVTENELTKEDVLAKEPVRDTLLARGR